MATSGSKTVKVTDWDNLVFEWEVTSQSITSNSSSVKWTLKLVAGKYGYISSNVPKDVSATVDGNTYSNVNGVNINNSSTKVLLSGHNFVYHDDDGTKTFNYSFSQEFDITFSGEHIGTISGSGTGTLPTIAHASQPSCVTWPEHTQNVGEFGQTISIHMNRKSSEYLHTVRYEFGSQTGTIAEKVENGTTWTIPLSLMNLIPNATKGSGTIYVDTIKYRENNTFSTIGTKSCGFTATVPASVKPSCTLTVTDITGCFNTYGGYIQNVSKLNIELTPTLAYQSPIKSYKITESSSGTSVVGRTETTTGVLRLAGTYMAYGEVTDSRGRSSNTGVTVNVIPYTAPKITKLTVHRCNQDGTENDQGEWAKVTFSSSITPLSNKNRAFYSVKYKKATESSYISASISLSQTTYEVADQTYVFAADDGSTYDVQLQVSDAHYNVTETTSVSTAYTPIHFGADGKSMALGKISEKAGWLENNMPTENLQTNVQIGNRYTMSSPGTAGTAGYVKMAEITVTAANADTPITFVFSRRQEQSTMTVHVQLKNASGTVATLNTIRYEGSNYGAFVQSADGTTWGLYVQKGSSYDTITLQDWWMSKTMESRVRVAFPGTHSASLPSNYYRATPAMQDSILDYIYPVGSVYISYSHNSPNTMFGGTWVRITNAFLWATDASGTIGKTGGEMTHTLTIAEMPSHSHFIGVANTASGSLSASNKIRFNNNATTYVGGIDTASAGSGSAHNNMPPYIQVSVWRRTA